jgi:hypothetical protein
VIIEERIQYEEAFRELKEKLSSVLVLIFPNFKLPFILYIDRSRERGFRAALY